MPFTNQSWNSPESNLDAEAYCEVCLIDLNEKGEKKIKSKCKLPVRSRPGAPYNINAMRAAAQALVGARGGVDAPPEAKRQAARKLIRLFREAGVAPPQSLYRVAGMQPPKEE